jgi:hypothetical protein
MSGTEYEGSLKTSNAILDALKREIHPFHILLAI